MHIFYLDNNVIVKVSSIVAPTLVLIAWASVELFIVYHQYSISSLALHKEVVGEWEEIYKMEDIVRNLTYRSRGRSLVEVILVRTFRFCCFSVFLSCFLDGIALLIFFRLFHSKNSFRPSVLLCFWLGSLQSFVLGIISVRREHKNDNDKDGLQN